MNIQLLYFLGRFLVKFTSHYCFRISINSINSVNSVNSVHSVNFVNSEQAVYSAVLPPSLILFWLLLFYGENAGAPIAVEGRNLQSPTFWEFARWIIDGGEFDFPWNF